MKKSIIKGACFILLLAVTMVIANVIYTHFFYPDDILEADAKLLLDLDSLAQKNDVLYFGESTNVTYAPTDTCKKAISELIQQLAPEVKVDMVDHGSYHAKQYLALIKNIKPNSRVKTIIVTMNLRTFGVVWMNSSMEASIEKATVMYSNYPPIIKRMMLALTCFDNRSFEERTPEIQDHWKHDKLNVPKNFPYQNTFDWDQGHCNAGLDTFPDGKWNLKQLALACNYIKIMGFSIDTNSNPRIKDFDEIVKIAKEKKLNLVFNLLSENVHCADSLGGKELAEIIRQNRDLLVKRYNKDGVIVVDNLELVNEKDFIEQDGINEHYDQAGRFQIAMNVVARAGEYLKPKQTTIVR